MPTVSSPVKAQYEISVGLRDDFLIRLPFRALTSPFGFRPRIGRNLFHPKSQHLIS